MFSIIVPIYKVEDYLTDCVNSIIRQSFIDFELILVNDGSPDKCLEICNEFAGLDDRIVVINKENGGLVNARKAGLKVAKGEYIFNIDADDWLEKDALGIIANSINLYQSDIITFDFFKGTNTGEIKMRQKLVQQFYDKQSMNNLIYPSMLYNIGKKRLWDIVPNIWCKVVKKEIVYDCQMAVDERITLGEDAACSYPFLLKANSMFFINMPLYHYRFNLSSIVHAYNHKIFQQNEILMHYLFNKMKDIDIIAQLRYYDVFMLQNLIKNEIKSYNNIKEKIRNIRLLCEGIRIKESLEFVKLKNFNLKHKIITFLIKNKQYVLLYVVFNMFKTFHR